MAAALANPEEVTMSAGAAAPLPDPAEAVARWDLDPAVVSAREASRQAHVAWNAVSPPDGQLAADATPRQRLLYHRMVMSEVTYEVAKVAAMGGNLS